MSLPSAGSKRSRCAAEGEEAGWACKVRLELVTLSRAIEAQRHWTATASPGAAVTENTG